MEKIIKKNYDCLYELGMNHETISIYLLNELKGYTFVDEIDKLHPGRFIRWFVLDEDTNFLNKGAFFCKMKNNQDLLCKTFPNNFFHLNSDTCVIFEKMKKEERIIATALDFARNNKKK